MSYITGFNPTASALVYQYINSTSSVTTTSGTFSAMSGVNLTVLETGTYRIDGCVSLMINASGIDNRAETQIFINGIGNSGSLQESGTTLSGVSLASLGWDIAPSMFIVANLTAGDVIDFRFRRTSGSATVTAMARSLMITKVG